MFEIQSRIEPHFIDINFHLQCSYAPVDHHIITKKKNTAEKMGLMSINKSIINLLNQSINPILKHYVPSDIVDGGRSHSIFSSTINIFCRKKNVCLDQSIDPFFKYYVSLEDCESKSRALLTASTRAGMQHAGRRKRNMKTGIKTLRTAATESAAPGREAYFGLQDPPDPENYPSKFDPDRFSG